MFTNKAFLFFYLLLSLVSFVQAILEICLEATKALIWHCIHARSTLINRVRPWCGGVPWALRSTWYTLCLYV